MKPINERYWEAFKAVVYSGVYSLFCWWLFLYTANFLWYIKHTPSQDLVIYAKIAVGIVWMVWTFGVVAIILAGMKKGIDNG